MKTDLALEVLAEITDLSDEELALYVPRLQSLAEHKFDDYEGFSAGERFLESLARWLVQFPDHNDLRRLVAFTTEELIFISRDELNHAIACVYPDRLKPALMTRVAETEGLDPVMVKAIAESQAFRSLRRKTLFLGLSDGARLDRLRRSSAELSHEQFWLSPEVGERTRASMTRKLADALDAQDLGGEPVFENVVVVDDFYGSGTSLIDWDEDEGRWSGKLTRAAQTLEEEGRDTGFLAADFTVTVVVYVASQQAVEHIETHLARFRDAWRLEVIQPIPAELIVQDPHLLELCEWFFDPVLVDEHKGAAPFGYREARLPVVLHHNTPNNSISLLWADSTDRPDGSHRRALFPRYERHHVDRP